MTLSCEDGVNFCKPSERDKKKDAKHIMGVEELEGNPGVRPQRCPSLQAVNVPIM